jgi:integrase
MAALNYPLKGSSIKVEPIRSLDDIKIIKRMLSDNPRNLSIFVLGINTNLRASDLLKIKVGQVRHLIPGEYFSLTEKKTKKKRDITINKGVYETLQALFETRPGAKDDEYLFPSRQGGGPLCVPYLNSLVKGWASAIKLKGNYGSHSLRKTFGYIHRTQHKTDIPTLMTLFNHSNQRQTLDYLCIQPEEIKDAYLKEI